MEIDRLAPARRPQGAPRGYQQWRDLLFLHWQVEYDQLRQLVPADLTLDLYEGVAYVGVVPFVMQRVRPRWWPAAAGLSFLETNVRTYVHVDGRPGVYFFSLDASSRMAVQAARWGWVLPYYNGAMQLNAKGNSRYYRLQRVARGPRHVVSYELGEMLGPSQPGTLEHFLLERYLLFVARRGRLQVGQVHHKPYPAQTVRVDRLEDELLAAAHLTPSAAAPIGHYAAGVDVEIFPLKPVRPLVDGEMMESKAVGSKS